MSIHNIQYNCKLSLASQVPGLIPSQNLGSLNIPGCKNSLPGRKNSRWILIPWYIYNTVLVSGVANSCTRVANSYTRGCLGPRVLRWNYPKQKFPKLNDSLSLFCKSGNKSKLQYPGTKHCTTFCTGTFSLYCKTGLTRRCLRSSFVVCEQCSLQHCFCHRFFEIFTLEESSWPARSLGIF
jgi:hypothetical protein